MRLDDDFADADKVEDAARDVEEAARDVEVCESPARGQARVCVTSVLCVTWMHDVGSVGLISWY